MSSQNKRRRDRKNTWVRIISLALAVLMLLSVVMAAVWRWSSAAREKAFPLW